MKTPIGGARERTRRAILEALADVVTESSGIGFSVQAVADRAGVTHRTVYNHFPTRDALCEAFAAYVDEQLASVFVGTPPDPSLPAEALPAAVETLYRTLALRDKYVRASVMLMLANRRPLESWFTRTQTLEKSIARTTRRHATLSPRQVAAAVRMFVSSMGWHLLTEQCRLSTDEAAAVSAWATRTLLDGAAAIPPTSARKTKGDARAPRGPRRKSVRRVPPARSR